MLFVIDPRPFEITLDLGAGGPEFRQGAGRSGQAAIGRADKPEEERLHLAEHARPAPAGDAERRRPMREVAQAAHQLGQAQPQLHPWSLAPRRAASAGMRSASAI